MKNWKKIYEKQNLIIFEKNPIQIIIKAEGKKWVVYNKPSHSSLLNINFFEKVFATKQQALKYAEDYMKKH